MQGCPKERPDHFSAVDDKLYKGNFLDVTKPQLCKALSIYNKSKITWSLHAKIYLLCIFILTPTF